VRIDAKTLPHGAHLHAEVAVVGAGPAGIVTALSLARLGRKVLLLESGHTRFDAAIQGLGNAAALDEHHVSMALATRRQLGGASNLWGGRCVPFDPIDFEPREIARSARWPIGYRDLEPYFQRACEWCVCGDAVFDARELERLAGSSLVPGFPEGRIGACALERWSLPTNFGSVYRREMERSDRLTLITGLTCTEIVCCETEAKVARLNATTSRGTPVTIQAERYVLACGGLESTRLLLASDRDRDGGIGNHSGHLGRWYMAHVESRIADVHFDTSPEHTIYGHERDADGVYVRRRITFSADFQVEQRLSNAAIWLVNPELADPEHGSGVLSLVYLALASPLGRWLIAEGIRQIHVKAREPVSIARHLRNVGLDAPRALAFALTFVYGRYLKRGRKVPGFFVPSATNVYPLMYHGEHLPDYSSRVELAEERDRLGMRRLRTHLRFAEADVESVLRAHERLDEYLREHGIGRLAYRFEDPRRATREQLSGGYHQAGTTRMSAHPRDGVVDGDLAVHGFADLFVASSSVFVTSGQANSTFMILALALRLCDHLERDLARRGNGRGRDASAWQLDDATAAHARV
jgi:choline dehydrogenase-like flavoprotein